MKPGTQLPDNVTQLKEGDSFCFGCHPGVPCFTDCCQQLDLNLTPYDVVRLKEVLGLTGKEFLERYTVLEYGQEDIFPKVYLAMQNDGRASCPFVSQKGCKVYEGRPSACRTYPLGRAAWLDKKGKAQSAHVLIREDHCFGFTEASRQNVTNWIKNQEISSYNEANDQLMHLIQHEKIKAGFRPTEEQCVLYVQTLYHLEEFREASFKETGVLMSDTALLQYAITWLIDKIFTEE